jgi:ABC transport system ATP-binding/permease protein
MVMGRDAVNDIILNDLEISRRHAAITFRGGRYFVEDLGSTNGTFVNGRRVTVATPLKDGDLLDLAQAVT